MKACKFCGQEVENTKKKCPACGSTELLRVCENCGEHFDGNFCPKCGVKVGQKGKTCPECQTIYFSNACPNCGYTPLRKTPEEQTIVHKHVYVNAPAAPAETSAKAAQTKSAPKTATKAKKKKSKWRWLIYFLAFCAVVSLFRGNDNKTDSTKSTTTKAPTVTATENVVEDSATGQGNAEMDAAVSTEAPVATATEKPEILLMPQGEPLSMSLVQQLFVSLNENTTRNDVDAFIESNGLVKYAFTRNSAYYIGSEGAAIRSRGRDREGEAVDINFNTSTGTSEGLVTSAEYAIHTGFSTHYALEYKDGEFYYEGKKCESGEAAMQLFLRAMQPEDTGNQEMVYAEDSVVNRFINEYNTINADDQITAAERGNIRTKYFVTIGGLYTELLNANGSAAESFCVTINAGNTDADKEPLLKAFTRVAKVLEPDIEDAVLQAGIKELTGDETIKTITIGKTLKVTYVPSVELSYGRNNYRIDVEASNYK